MLPEGLTSMINIDLSSSAIEVTEREVKLFSNMETLKTWLLRKEMIRLEGEVSKQIRKQLANQDFYKIKME